MKFSHEVQEKIAINLNYLELLQLIMSSRTISLDYNRHRVSLNKWKETMGKEKLEDKQFILIKNLHQDSFDFMVQKQLFLALHNIGTK
jgi:hypothetical protein